MPRGGGSTSPHHHSGAHHPLVLCCPIPFLAYMLLGGVYVRTAPSVPHGPAPPPSSAPPGPGPGLGRGCRCPPPPAPASPAPSAQVIGVLSPNDIVGQSGAAILLLILMLQNGYIIAEDDIQPWWVWAYWFNPLQYGLTSLALIEFHSDRYAQPLDPANPGLGTVGDYYLGLKKMTTDDSRLALGFIFNACWYGLMTILHSVVLVCVRWRERFPPPEAPHEPGISVPPAMPMPFMPCSLAWSSLCYDVDVPGVKGKEGKLGLRLLSHVSGFANPGTLTALMGSSGAGKTTLLDVLAGRKTTGRIEVLGPSVSSGRPGGGGSGGGTPHKGWFGDYVARPVPRATSVV